MWSKIGVAACAAGLLAACAPPAQELTGEALVARGDYLVNSVVLCNDCHTPMTPEGPDMAHALQGADLPMAPTIEIPFATIAPPVAGLPPGWTEEQFIHFLQTGERPTGVPVLPPMPPYRLNAEDARAVAAYIATLPPAGG
jgi:mono/diheme cytochrome c family protein